MHHAVVVDVHHDDALRPVHVHDQHDGRRPAVLEHHLDHDHLCKWRGCRLMALTTLPASSPGSTTAVPRRPVAIPAWRHVDVLLIAAAAAA